ncbi:hypothetical protein CA13_51030 [Planctomycetes bacterium CA13]|uniref:Ice-binding protein C-terminal domain-containing protein n=1 Tax=Novipirellula herctigrandis TaxID=2527986 RepID=A0A5C5Z980_9BACT|nr:hypothetical protein CA13_51030 [Planctomycetes bacterium CA13]
MNILMRTLIFGLVLTFGGISQAGVIVQWGSTDGAVTNPTPNQTDIVTANRNFASKPTNYTAGTEANPVVGANYYNTPASIGRTPIFNTAATMVRDAGALTLQTAQIQHNANHDRIRLVGTDTATDLNLTRVTAMVAWESANWLSSDNTLETLSHVGFRQNTGTTAFRFLMQKSDDSWYASTSQNWTGGGTATGDFFITDAASEDWFSFDPATIETGPIFGSMASSVDVNNVKSVGFYFNATDAGAASMGIQSGYFQATAASAVPEPSSLAMLGACGLGATLLRRRKTKTA